MRRIVFAPDFVHWRKTARKALADELPPEEILWEELGNGGQEADLFEQPATSEPLEKHPEPSARVPKDFLELATTVACHRRPDRWALLYRALWRLTHGEPQLLRIVVDQDVMELLKMNKEIGRDIHKMRAFVRFREINRDGETWYIAWFEPAHRILRLNSKFFTERFAQNRWSILTPDECMYWDGAELTFTEGAKRENAPENDQIEELWRTYYSKIFNPARVKIQAMQSKMPKNCWKNLPEATVIPELLRKAPIRVETMIKKSALQQAGYKDALVPETDDLEELKRAAENCDACPFARNATQTVFGEGPANAAIILLGEQPGDQEDREGRPFVGPAGLVLDRALKTAGVDRSKCYVTNAVKHFKWEPRGKRRIHQTPTGRDIEHCRLWFEAELRAIKPKVLVCLGSTATTAIFGKTAKVMKDRGRWMQSAFAENTLITVHPSSILRAIDEAQQERAFESLVSDLQLITGLSEAR
jgi:probable DNA metabolism protein